MREFVLWGVAAMIVFGVAEAHAMGGSGNLSPEASPYAILEPQTLATGAPALAVAPVAQPAPVRPRRQRHR
jgi:hypothetical protein